MIEFVYVFCGLVLPAFYLPQIARLWQDETQLAGYSIGKSFSQLLLRIPALVFALLVVKHPLMNLVVGLDVIGRAIEFGVALWSMRRQGMCVRSIALGWLNKLHPTAVGWSRFAALAVSSGSLAVFVSHAIEHKADTTPTGTEITTATGGYLDSQ